MHAAQRLSAEAAEQVALPHAGPALEHALVPAGAQ